MKIFILFICLLKNILSENEVITDFGQVIDTINKNQIKDSNKIIDSIKNIMNEYPFINILKAPPKINDKDYFESVDIINELDNLKSQISSLNGFYDFYQNLFKIIRKTNDLHVGFDYFGDIKELSDIILIFPFGIKIDNEKKLFLKPKNLIDYLEIGENIQNHKKIIEKENVPIKSINDKEPFEFIRNFCKDYFTFIK